MGDYSGIPYVCTLLNCMLWVVYGLPIVKFQVLVVTINAAGCAIEFTYLTLYLIHAAKKIRVRNLRMNITPIFSAIIPVILLLHVHDQSLPAEKIERLYFVSNAMLHVHCFFPSPQMKVMKLLTAVIVGFAIVVVLVLLLVHDKNKRKLIIGSLCAVFAVGMYASPLTVMVST